MSNHNCCHMCNTIYSKQFTKCPNPECKLNREAILAKELLMQPEEMEALKFNEPEHYHKGEIDVIKFMELFFKDANLTASEGFFIGNILKYTCRFKNKNGMDDLIKAKDYIERLIAYETKAGSQSK